MSWAEENQRRENAGPSWGLAAPLCREPSPVFFSLARAPGQPASRSVGPGALGNACPPSPSLLHFPARLLLIGEMLVTCSSTLPPLSGASVNAVPVCSSEVPSALESCGPPGPS